MMPVMQPAQKFQARDGIYKMSFGQVVRQVQPFVIQVIGKRGGYIKHSRVERKNKVDGQGSRQHKAN